MSYLKFSPNLFLEQSELAFFKQSLDDNGFRNFLIQNSATFGWIRKPNVAFTNGLPSDGGSQTLNIAALSLIDSNGQLISSLPISQLAIPVNNGHWYWVKVSYLASPILQGQTFSIDTQGNLTCTSSNASLLTALRGQPNYPSRVSFPNAVHNTLEYDAEAIVDNNHATLTGSFTAEVGLQMQVVGTFTSGYAPLTSEKNIFQYDSALITLIQSDTSTPPAHSSGLEFFVARVQNTGSTLLIEDQRDIDIWQTNADFYQKYLDLTGNPLIGVEKIMFDEAFTTRDKNVVQIAWGFRATTFTVNLKLNQVTISAGNGGLFKNPTYFTNGAFNNWRLYTSDGEYFNVQSNILSGGNIQLTFDQLEATSFFSDVNSTVQIVQTLLVVPQAEEIEIICTPTIDISAPEDVPNTSTIHQVFPINNLYGKIRLIVYEQTRSQYSITYRYKNLLSYGPVYTIPADIVGYYAEDQFNDNGYQTGTTQTSYSGGLITLKMSSGSYINFKNFINPGDIVGVDETTLTGVSPVQVTVGVNKQYQHYTGTTLTLAGDVYINLNRFLNPPINSMPCKNGNRFYLHFAQNIVLNGHNIIICQDYTSSIINTKLKTLSATDIDYINNSEAGLVLTFNYNGSNKWVLSKPVTDYRASDRVAAGSLAAIGTEYVLHSIVPSTTQSIGNMIAVYNGAWTNDQDTALTFAIYQGGTVSGYTPGSIGGTISGGTLMKKLVMHVGATGIAANTITVMSMFDLPANSAVTVTVNSSGGPDLPAINNSSDLYLSASI